MRQSSHCSLSSSSASSDVPYSLAASPIHSEATKFPSPSAKSPPPPPPVALPKAPIIPSQPPGSLVESKFSPQTLLRYQRRDRLEVAPSLNKSSGSDLSRSTSSDSRTSQRTSGSTNTSIPLQPPSPTSASPPISPALRHKRAPSVPLRQAAMACTHWQTPSATAAELEGLHFTGMGPSLRQYVVPSSQFRPSLAQPVPKIDFDAQPLASRPGAWPPHFQYSLHGRKKSRLSFSMEQQLEGLSLDVS